MHSRKAEEHEREEAERLRCETEEREADGHHGEEEANEVLPAPKKKRRKRKADTQLVPEDGVAAGRPSRTRKTPQEATQERAAKLVTAVRGAGKPRYEYVVRSPIKGTGGSTTRYEICRVLIC
ncbi:hypothetical protein DFH07DRAFT_972279 [Mycena maculata]|uniref:Uncharacterized protein n=1 Tax=Mycena maculata TaxID=230809 RepID=A0AAD7HJG0_9AGAR|nr:hypothetical protein DFH07DRAFT_972279 [Mycena maculata]